MLVHNAGIASPPPNSPKTTKDGKDLVYVTNFLGSFLMTHLLEDCLTKDARVVLTSSSGHYSAAKTLFQSNRATPQKAPGMLVMGLENNSEDTEVRKECCRRIWPLISPTGSLRLTHAIALFLFPKQPPHSTCVHTRLHLHTHFRKVRRHVAHMAEHSGLLGAQGDGAIHRCGRGRGCYDRKLVGRGRRKGSRRRWVLGVESEEDECDRFLEGSFRRERVREEGGEGVEEVGGRCGCEVGCADLIEIYSTPGHHIPCLIQSC